MNKNIKQIVEEVLNEYFDDPNNEFLKKHNIDPYELSYMGSGDYGEAYSTNDGKILKITTSKSEYNLADEIKNSNNPIFKEAFAEIYDIDIINGKMYILQEELEEDSSIEDLYYQLEDLLSNEGIPIQYVHMLDPDEHDINDELNDFINQIEEINRAYRTLGVEASDIKSDNLGYDKQGNLKAFDIDDKSQ